jgi:hypothetical protein
MWRVPANIFNKQSGVEDKVYAFSALGVGITTPTSKY